MIWAKKIMNNVVLTGRLTKDPETRYSQGNTPTAVTRFTIAVERRFKRDNEPSADFISCTAFGSTADFIDKYFRKGAKINLRGRIQTGDYTNKEGQKIYTTTVVVEDCEFGESKKNTDSASGAPTAHNNSQQSAPQNNPQQYAPQNNSQQYAPQNNPQQYAPQNNPQQYAPQNNSQQYAPQNNSQQYAPQTPNPADGFMSGVPYDLDEELPFN